MLCRVMEVSAGGYYARRKRLSQPPCLRPQSLRQLVGNCYFENRRRYGARRIQKALGKTGVKIGRRKVRRLMKEENLKAIEPKAFKRRTTDSEGTTAAPNLLAEIKFEECAPQKIILGDITPHPPSVAADFVIWRFGRIKSPEESSAGVWGRK